MTKPNPLAVKSGYYEIGFDPETGIVVSEASGFWTMAIAKEYLAELTKATDMSRTQTGSARILFDFSASQVQAGEVFANGHHFLRQGERAAVIVTSALLKMQLGRQDPQGDHGFFADRASALAWLLSAKAGH